jgi:hypothetical protein
MWIHDCYEDLSYKDFIVESTHLGDGWIITAKTLPHGGRYFEYLPGRDTIRVYEAPRMSEWYYDCNLYTDDIVAFLRRHAELRPYHSGYSDKISQS